MKPIILLLITLIVSSCNDALFQHEQHVFNYYDTIDTKFKIPNNDSIYSIGLKELVKDSMIYHIYYMVKLQFLLLIIQKNYWKLNY